MSKYCNKYMVIISFFFLSFHFISPVRREMHPIQNTNIIYYFWISHFKIHFINKNGFNYLSFQRKTYGLLFEKLNEEKYKICVVNIYQNSITSSIQSQIRQKYVMTVNCFDSFKQMHGPIIWEEFKILCKMLSFSPV